MTLSAPFKLLALSASALALTACAATGGTAVSATAAAPMAASMAERSAAEFEADRHAILAMAGEYAVTFDFSEFMPIEAGYELAEDKTTPAREVVYVIEDDRRLHRAAALAAGRRSGRAGGHQALAPGLAV
jgi:hypothetical protein